MLYLAYFFCGTTKYVVIPMISASLNRSRSILHYRTFFVQSDAAEAAATAAGTPAELIPAHAHRSYRTGRDDHGLGFSNGPGGEWEVTV